MGGCLNNIGLQGHPLDTDVRVLKEPRTVPYNRIGSRKRIRTVSVPYRSVTGSSRDAEISLDLLATLIGGASLDLAIRPRSLTIQNKEISICHLKKVKAAIPAGGPK
jgi:hypothetical protein